MAHICILWAADGDPPDLFLYIRNLQVVRYKTTNNHLRDRPLREEGAASTTRARGDLYPAVSVYKRRGGPPAPRSVGSVVV